MKKNMGSTDRIIRNDDWLIQEKSGSIIKLKDDNDQHLEEIFLEKI